MPGNESLSNWLRLTLVPGIGGETQRKLLTAFGLPGAVFSASRSELRRVISDKAIGLLLETPNDDAVASAFAWAAGEDQHIVTLADPEYPQALLEISDPPTVLYVRGRLALLNRPILSIVGSRNPTAQGIQNAERFPAALADIGLTIASGLALGIDAAAHRGALATDGDTIAFIGTGIDRIYPARNRDLALEIGRRGAIVSEFPIGTPVTAANFPRRNRLISGISRGVLVVEAAIQSGSLITARLAGEQGREVFAIPGSIHSPQARGCHKLIKEGAKLVETAQDVLDELAPSIIGIAASVPPREAAAPNHTSGNELLSCMGFEPCGLDELASRSGLSAAALSTELLHLELAGRIASLPGGLFQQLSANRTG